MKMYSNSINFFITNNGCIRRKIDAQHIIDFLIRNGYKNVNEPENAHMLFFISCAADNVAEAVAINSIFDLEMRKKPHAKIYVIGCLSKINPKAIEAIEDIACIIGPTEMNQLDVLFPNLEFPFIDIPEPYCVSNEVFTSKGLKFQREDFNSRDTESNSLNDNLIANNAESQYETFKSKSNIIRIARGCLSSCKYCCIRQATGRLNSRPVISIVEQLKNILEINSPYFTLTAEDVGAYGQDIGTNFPKLLNSIAAIDDNIKLAANAFNPRSLSDFIFEKISAFCILNSIEIVHDRVPLKLGSLFGITINFRSI